MTDRSGNVQAIRVVAERVVLADSVFTTPAVVRQAGTGVMLARIAGFPMNSGWVLYAIVLYVVAGGCWLPVVWLQIRMRDLARVARATARRSTHVTGDTRGCGFGSACRRSRRSS